MLTVRRCQGQGRVESWEIRPIENLSLNIQEDHFHEGTPFVLSKASEVWRDAFMASCTSSFLPGTSHVHNRQHRAEAGHWSELGLNEPVWGTRSQQSAESLNQGSLQYAKNGAATSRGGERRLRVCDCPLGTPVHLAPNSKGQAAPSVSFLRV